MSAERYIGQCRAEAGDAWVSLVRLPTYRDAVEALNEYGVDTSPESGSWRVLLDLNQVDLTDRDVMLGLMPTDPVLGTVFEFARTQGMAGIGEISGGGSAQASWVRHLQQLEAGRAGLSQPVRPELGSREQAAAAAGRMTALGDFLALMHLALQALAQNAAEAHGELSSEALDRIEVGGFGQARAMLVALGVSESELDVAGIRPSGAGR